MFWTIVILVIIIIIVLAILGGASPSNGGPDGSGSGNSCSICKNLSSYWEKLGPLGKIKMASWYALKKADCYLRCRSHGLQ